MFFWINNTPGYVAPEILNLVDRHSKYDKVCDLFSCGCVFYKLLFGHSLFMGNTFNEILAQNKKCNFILDGPEMNSIPFEAQELLKRMLAKNPSDRISAQQALESDFFNKPSSPLLSKSSVQLLIRTQIIQCIQYSSTIFHIFIRQIFEYFINLFVFINSKLYNYSLLFILQIQLLFQYSIISQDIRKKCNFIVQHFQNRNFQLQIKKQQKQKLYILQSCISSRNIFQPTTDGILSEAESPFQRISQKYKNQVDFDVDIQENKCSSIQIRQLPSVKKPTCVRLEDSTIGSFYAKDPLSSFKKLKGTSQKQLNEIKEIKINQFDVDQMQRIQLFNRKEDN